MVFEWEERVDRVPKEELFSADLSNKILTQYLQIDPELAVLLENQNHCNIHYPRNHASVEHRLCAVSRECWII